MSLKTQIRMVACLMVVLAIWMCFEMAQWSKMLERGDQLTDRIQKLEDASSKTPPTRR